MSNSTIPMLPQSIAMDGTEQFEAVQAGVVAETFSVPVGIGFGAVVLLLFGLLLLWRVPRLRHMP